MNQARITNLISKLNYTALSKHRRLKNSNGPEGRIWKLQKTLTALIKYERIELNYHRADETRGYVELLIAEGLRYGPQDRRILELADFWILEKQLIHKFINVLLPRYHNYRTSYTNIYNFPSMDAGIYLKRAILELKGKRNYIA